MCVVFFAFFVEMEIPERFFRKTVLNKRMTRHAKRAAVVAARFFTFPGIGRVMIFTGVFVAA